MKKKMSGKQAVMEMLKAERVTHIFGNPGTSEGPLIDMLGDYPELSYFMALQESVAVGMGDAYARSTNTASFVSLHVDSGLANGIALMLDALNSGTPMVVTSANYDSRKINETKTDLAELVRPVTKWAVELDLPDQIPSVMRRAFNEANSHPKGPVYVGFTANALEGIADMNIIPSGKIHDEIRPDNKAIAKAAQLIKNSKNPVLMLGDRVSDDDATNEAIELAEILGSPVYQFRGGEVSFPTKHPQYMGIYSLRSKTSRETLENFDLVIAVGMDVFEELFYWGDVILSSTQKLIHVDPIPGRIGRTEPTDVGVISNCKTALKDITNLVKNHIDEKNMAIDIDEISFRKHRSKLDAQHRYQTFENSVKENWDLNPMSPARMMYELSNAVPENAMILDDSVSNREAVRHYFAAGKRGDIVGIRGQSIGGGIGATMGLQCANPGNPVFGIIGDGSAMMTIQGLWTAANDNIPCVFVICNNGMYRILRVNYNIYQSEILKETEPAGENLLHSEFSTPFNIATIAQGMGLHGERITDPNQIAPAVTRVLKTGGPGVLDIVIDGSL